MITYYFRACFSGSRYCFKFSYIASTSMVQLSDGINLRFSNSSLFVCTALPFRGSLTRNCKRYSPSNFSCGGGTGPLKSLTPHFTIIDNTFWAMDSASSFLPDFTVSLTRRIYGGKLKFLRSSKRAVSISLHGFSKLRNTGWFG